MRLHKEGFWIIPLVAILVCVIYLLLTWLLPYIVFRVILGVIALVFLFLVVYFFRVPIVHTPNIQNTIIAPAEGKIVVIEKVFEPEFLNKEVMQISIFMSPLNVHVNRSPINGIVKFFKYHPGKYLVAWHPKSSTLNERTTIVFETAEGRNILMRQIAGTVARRICFYKNQDEAVHVGQEVGFIRFGSRVDLFIDLDSEILVNIGDKTIGGETLIAKLSS